MGLSEIAEMLAALIEAKVPGVRAKRWEKNGKLRVYLRLDGGLKGRDLACWLDPTNGRTGKDDQAWTAGFTPVMDRMDALLQGLRELPLMDVFDGPSLERAFAAHVLARLGLAPAAAPEPAAPAFGSLYELLGCEW